MVEKAKKGLGEEKRMRAFLRELGRGKSHSTSSNRRKMFLEGENELLYGSRS